MTLRIMTYYFHPVALQKKMSRTFKTTIIHKPDRMKNENNEE